MKHLDLFSGIGGFALAAEMVWPKVEHTFCDNDSFAQAILKKHWPNSKIYDDIKKLANPTPADLVTGGFPCQPFSSAGKRRGTQDDRHLWPEMLRVIRLATPRWVIGENVGGLITWNGGLVLDQVCIDLEAEGYEVWPVVIPAAAVGAPHRRDRVWIIAHALGSDARGNTRKLSRSSEEEWLQERQSMGEFSSADKVRNVANADGSNSRGRRTENDGQRSSEKERRTLWPKIERRTWDEDWPAAAARLCAMDDGLPRGLARSRGWRNAALKGAGNAIVPQVAAEIMRAIQTADPLL